MNYSWLATLYAKFGAPHPRLSYCAVFVIGGLFFMGCWWLVSADYEREDASQKFASHLQDDVAKLSARIDNIQSSKVDPEQRKREQAEKEQRKKNRERVGAFLQRGNDLKSRCDSLDERPALPDEASRWADETASVLAEIDKSYAARFQGASGNTYQRTLGGVPVPQVNNNVWNFMNLRTDALTRILETMPN